MTIRPLVPGDEAALEAFLAGHAESSMFLRANLRQAGLVDRGAPAEGLYVGRFAGAAITGAIAHYGYGNVLIQAPDDPQALAHALAATTKRPVAGLLGPLDQVNAIRPILAPQGMRASKDSAEILFALPLERLVVPALLGKPGIAARQAVESDRELLAGWWHDYEVELLGETPGPALLAKARADFRRRGAAAGGPWLLLVDGAPAATQSFNAALPDIVQVGGVWTPPALRGRGYARAVVAAALRDARARGVAHAILFTGGDNLAAQRAYRALGFTPVGDYALVLFRKPAPAAP